MKRLIEDTLIKCGMPVGLCGFQYIVEAVHILKEEPNIKICYMYEVVAKIMYTTASRVERGIRHAFLRTREKGNAEMVKKYFGTDKTNSSSLKSLLLHIKREMEETENEANS